MTRYDSAQRAASARRQSSVRFYEGLRDRCLKRKNLAPVKIATAGAARRLESQKVLVMEK